MSSKACCFPIPGGAKAIAIGEFVFLGFNVGLVILSFIAKNWAGAVLSLLFLLVLGVAAYFLLRSVSQRSANMTLPYIIIRIIQLILQGFTVVAYVLGLVLFLLGYQETKPEFGDDVVSRQGGVAVQSGGFFAVVTAATIFGTIFTIAWFIWGIFGVVVAWKTRNHFKNTVVVSSS